MNEKFYIIKYEEQYPYCACFQNVEWNLKLITDKVPDSGYIVQRFRRRMETTSKKISENYGNKSYYEAWRVISGTIIEEDKGKGADDFFWIGQQLCPYEQFYDSLDSSGIIKFSGEILWIGEESSLFSIVDNWNRHDVKEANGLKATYSCPELDNIAFPMKRFFSHRWDLLTEQDIYLAARQIVFQMCPGNDVCDYEYCDFLLGMLFRDSRPEMSKRIKKEWEESKKAQH